MIEIVNWRKVVILTTLHSVGIRKSAFSVTVGEISFKLINLKGLPCDINRNLEEACYFDHF